MRAVQNLILCSCRCCGGTSCASLRGAQTLDWVSYLGLAPERFARYSGLEQYFAMARGTDDVQLALDMSKYFDTNYRA